MKKDGLEITVGDLEEETKERANRVKVENKEKQIIEGRPKQERTSMVSEMTIL